MLVHCVVGCCRVNVDVIREIKTLTNVTVKHKDSRNSAKSLGIKRYK